MIWEFRNADPKAVLSDIMSAITDLPAWARIVIDCSEDHGEHIAVVTIYRRAPTEELADLMQTNLGDSRWHNFRTGRSIP